MSILKYYMNSPEFTFKNEEGSEMKKGQTHKEILITNFRKHFCNKNIKSLINILL